MQLDAPRGKALPHVASHSQIMLNQLATLPCPAQEHILAAAALLARLTAALGEDAAAAGVQLPAAKAVLSKLQASIDAAAGEVADPPVGARELKRHRREGLWCSIPGMPLQPSASQCPSQLSRFPWLQGLRGPEEVRILRSNSVVRGCIVARQ